MIACGLDLYKNSLLSLICFWEWRYLLNTICSAYDVCLMQITSFIVYKIIWIRYQNDTSKKPYIYVYVIYNICMSWHYLLLETFSAYIHNDILRD